MLECLLNASDVAGQKDQDVVRGSELSAHPAPPQTSVEERGLEADFITSGQWFTQSCLHNATYPKPLNAEAQRASGSVNTLRC